MDETNAVTLLGIITGIPCVIAPGATTDDFTASCRWLVALWHRAAQRYLILWIVLQLTSTAERGRRSTCLAIFNVARLSPVQRYTGEEFLPQQ